MYRGEGAGRKLDERKFENGAGFASVRIFGALLIEIFAEADRYLVHESP